MDDFAIEPNEHEPREVPMSKPKRKPRAKQLAIPGTERKEIPEVESAAEAYREARDERMELTKVELQAKAELLAVMRANKIPVYRYHDEDGEEIEARIDDEPTVKVRKTGEVDRGDEPEDMAPEQANGSRDPDGLVAQAMRAQADAGVDETEDGDVVPFASNGAAKPKRKRNRKARA